MTSITHEQQVTIASSLSGSRIPRLLLHLEGLVVFLAAITLYIDQGFGAVTIVLLILAPDLSMVGYLVNKQAGSMVYNAAHFYALPIALLILGVTSDWSLGIQLGLIWAAHIGVDRTLGYGLKYPSASKDTHLQRV